MGKFHGRRFRQGLQCIIEEDVVIGDNVTLGHNVVLKNGTRIGNDVTIGDYCCTTGLCYIGNHVDIRTKSVISKGVIVGDCVFIGAGVMTSHTKRVYHHRPGVPRKQLITRIGYGAVIGSNCNLTAGVSISANVIVGYSSFVSKNLSLPGIYFGHPAKWGSELNSKYVIEVPVGWRFPEFSEKLLEKYLPYI